MGVIRPSTSHLSTGEAEDEWTLRANCRGKPPGLFEFYERDSPACEGMNHQQRVEFNDTNFRLAEEICIECPVMLKCGEAADRDDKYWTVRGGLPPVGLVNDAKRYANVGRPVGARTRNPKTGKPVGDRECGRGHLVQGGGRCKECKRVNNKLRQRKVRTAEREASG
jgi:hypothetical protein